MLNKNNIGFTVVELLIVIVVIAILAVVGTTTHQGLQTRSLDTTRMNDVKRIADALALYELKNGNFIETGSGCASAGNGNGWFSYSGGTYPKSMSDCLKDAGYLPGGAVDPTGSTLNSSPTNEVYAYMKYHCGSGATKQAFIYAKLKTKPQSATATDGTCAPTVDTSWGMNYYVEVK